MQSEGVEPEHKFAEVARKRNLSVKAGVFPNKNLTCEPDSDLILVYGCHMGTIPPLPKCIEIRN